MPPCLANKKMTAVAAIPPASPNSGIAITPIQPVRLMVPWISSINKTTAMPAPALIPRIPGSASPLRVIP
ncbi:hypothetical protein D3C73_1518800 [compost metagenome]